MTNKNDFWQQQRIEIINCLLNLPIDTFRNWGPIRSIPLFEMWHWIGYMEGAQKTYDRIKEDEVLVDKWVKSMSPKKLSIVIFLEPDAIIAPTIVIPDIAFEPDINGV